MGSSFTHYRENGFWTRDGFIEAALALLVVECERMHRDAMSRPPWMEELLDSWTVNASVGLNGSVSASLDEHDAPERIALILAAAKRARMRVDRSESEMLEVLDPEFDARADRVCGAGKWYRPGAPGLGVLHVLDAFVALLDGTLAPRAAHKVVIDSDTKPNKVR